MPPNHTRSKTTDSRRWYSTLKHDRVPDRLSAEDDVVSKLSNERISPANIAPIPPSAMPPKSRLDSERSIESRGPSSRAFLPAFPRPLVKLECFLDDCPPYAWVVKTEMLLNFLRWNCDKFTTGFKFLVARCHREFVTWE